MWRKEKLGHYSVKSSYLLIQDGKENSQTSDNSGFWRQMWNLKIPVKVKHFLWRAVSNCLPTKDLLRRRKVDVNLVCPMCQNSAETVLHILVECSFASACNQLVLDQAIQEEFHTFADWLHLVFEQCRSEKIRVLVMVCWMIWKSRNDLGGVWLEVYGLGKREWASHSVNLCLD